MARTILIQLGVVLLVLVTLTEAGFQLIRLKRDELDRLIRDAPPAAPSATTEVKIDWITVPYRNMADGLEYNNPNENHTMDRKDGRQLLTGLTAVTGALTTLEGVASSSNGIISGAISNLQGIASLIREGKDLAEMFGFGKKENAILVDSRCKSCNLTVRCLSRTEDTGDFEVNFPDGYILKFFTYLPNGTPFNVGIINWVCHYKDLNTGRHVRNDAFGGKSPRQLFNLFEVRDRGVWHMDKETGRIDARQPVAFW